MRRLRPQGFTLIELMIVVAILAIMVSIAIPRFSKIVAKSQESTTKGNLGAIRGALSIYYSENEGVYPGDDLNSLMVGKRLLQEMPGAIFPATPSNSGHGGPHIGVLTGHIPDGSDDVAAAAGWLYDNGGGASDTFGRVMVNCSHSDIYGDPWTSK